jgi:hypothetical protein
MGFIAVTASAALGQVPAGLTLPGKYFSFDSIADEAVIGFGDLKESPFCGVD